jgi:hypothetical protein
VQKPWTQIDATSPPQEDAGQANRALELALAVILIALAVVLLLDLPIYLLAHTERSGSEGWNAYHALALAEGRPLYTPPDSLFVNNYPPLSFVVLAALGSLIGDHVIAGRLLSAVSFAYVLVATFSIARLLGASRSVALVAPAFVLAFNAAHGDKHLGVNDPQWLGHALSIAALLVFMRGHESLRRKLAIVLLVVAALSVKLMYVAVPLTIAAFVARYETRSLPVWILVSVAVAVATTAAWLFMFGPDMIRSMAALEQSRGLGLRKLLRDVSPILPLLLPAALLTVIAVAARPLDRNRWMLLCLAVFAAASAALFHTAEGVRANASFELAIVLALGAAVGLQRLGAATERRHSATVARALLAGLLVLVMLPVLAERLPNVVAAVTTAGEARQSNAAVIERLASSPGPAFCETLLLCYWAGQSPPIDTWTAAIRMRAGVLSVERLATLVRDGYFSVVQLRAPHPSRPVARGAADGIGAHHLPPAINALWATRYEIFFRDDRNVLLRRRPA